MPNTPVPIPPTAEVLVTNATQPVPLHIIKQLLEYGCRVRAATPMGEDASRLDQLFKEHWVGKFNRISMPPGVPHNKAYFEDAVKGVYAIVHTATIPTMDSSPLEDAWQRAADSVTFLLEAAEREPTVRAVVYTSSMAAAAPLVTPTDLLVTEDSWNTRDTLAAMTSKLSRWDDYDRSVMNNSCLVRAEQALWQWAREQRPAFKVNVVSPSNVIGHELGLRDAATRRDWVWRLYHFGDARRDLVPGAGPTQAHWYVDVEDVALLHVAAIFDPDVSGDRLQAWGCYRDHNDVLTALQGVDSEGKPHKLIENDGVHRGQLYTRFGRVSSIFKRWKGKECWKGFEKTIGEYREQYKKKEQEASGVDKTKDMLVPITIYGDASTAV